MTGKQSLEPGDLLSFGDGVVLRLEYFINDASRPYRAKCSTGRGQFVYHKATDIAHNYGPAEQQHDNGTVTRVMTLPVTGKPNDLDRVRRFHVGIHFGSTDLTAAIDVDPKQPPEWQQKLARQIVDGEVFLPPIPSQIKMPADPEEDPIYLRIPPQSDWDVWTSYLGPEPDYIPEGTHDLAPVRELVERYRQEAQ